MDPVYRFASGLQMEIKRYGSPQKLSEPVRLRAGTLSMIYERGNLRYILNGDEEIIRMIYPAVRDKDWLNVPDARMEEDIKVLDRSFTIRYRSLYSSGDIKFSSEILIEGKEDNTITFSMEGKALSTFMKNRIGLCVLHPVKECTGIPCTILHSDNTSEMTRFPREICPRQPFTDISSMVWKTGGGQNILNFTGDIFETEDQRNWTDDSFKTYSTPLSLPYPVTIGKGETIYQKVELLSQPSVSKVPRYQNVNKIFLSPKESCMLPPIGIGQSTRKEPLTENEISILRKIPFDHYRVDLYLFEDSWKTKADLGLTESSKLGFQLELALFFGESAEKEIDDFINWYLAGEKTISIIHLFHINFQSTPEWLIKKVVPELRKHLTRARLSIGTNSNFAQLNMNPIESGLTDNISYSIHPQEHASDNLTLVENIDAQRYTVESAKKLYPGKKIWVAPVTIQRRFNANIENFEKRHGGSQLSGQVDCRLMSLFGAAWTCGSLKKIASAGAAGITYYETAGERGIIQGDYQTRWPESFFSVKGMIFPSYFIFKFILGNKTFRILKSESSAPLLTDHIILTDGLNAKMLIVNYTDVKQKVKIPESMTELKIRQLHEGNFSDAVSDENWLESETTKEPLINDLLWLEPYSITFIDGGIKLH